MDICFQREVLREATIYTTIAMGLHFLSQSEKVDFAFLAIPWQKTWNSSVYYYLTPPLFRSVCSTGQIRTTIVNRPTWKWALLTEITKRAHIRIKKMGLQVSECKDGDHFFATKPPPPPPKKMVEQTFVLRNAFTTFGRVNLMNLKKWNFWTALSPFTLSTDPRIEMQCKRAVVK